MFDDFDQNTSVLSESTARQLSRRAFLIQAVKGLVAAVAGLTLGQFTVGAAEAACTCGGQSCASIGKSCPSSGCPSNCTVCKNTTGCSKCTYPTGYWVSCTGQGACGNGYRLCYDCKCGTCDSGVCYCLTTCFCCNCCSPADVEAEMQRLVAMGLSREALETAVN